MIPILTLTGFSNVGKTTIFGKIVLNDNIIDNFYGLTLNKIYKICNKYKYIFLLSDNKGININLRKNDLNFNIYINKSDIILYIIDLYFDFYKNKEIINILKKRNKYLFLILNKIDLKINLNIFELLNLGLGKPYLISAINNINIENTINEILFLYCFNKNCSKKKYNKKNIKVSIIGNYNTGKSTLINFLIKENQIIVSNKINSTKDIVLLNIKYKNCIITFLDTFGLKFKRKNKKFFFVNKTLKNIIKSNLVIFLICNFNDLDYEYIKFIIKNGLNFFFLISKSDLINLKQKIFLKNIIKKNIKKEKFLIFFFTYFKNKYINYILKYIVKLYKISIIKIKTNILNKMLKLYIVLNKNFNEKLNNIYIYQVGKNPLIFIIYSKNKFSQIKCFKNFLIKNLKLKSIGIIFKLIIKN